MKATSEQDFSTVAVYAVGPRGVSQITMTDAMLVPEVDVAGSRRVVDCNGFRPKNDETQGVVLRVYFGQPTKPSTRKKEQREGTLEQSVNRQILIKTEYCDKLNGLIKV